MLNDKVINLKFEIINFGMGGYSIDQYHDSMKGVLKIVECDLVMVGFYWNDLKKTSLQYLSDITNFQNGARIILDFNNIPIFKNIDRNLHNIRNSEANKEFSSSMPWHKKTKIYKFIEKRSNININGGLPTPSKWDFVFNEFLGMRKLTKQYNLPPPIVILLYNGSVNPDKNNFKNPKGDLAQKIQVQQFVGKQLTDNNFSVIDTLPLFKKHSNMSMAASEWENHPNYLGHYIYAKSILDFLIFKYFVTKRQKVKVN